MMYPPSPFFLTPAHLVTILSYSHAPYHHSLLSLQGPRIESMLMQRVCRGAGVRGVKVVLKKQRRYQLRWAWIGQPTSTASCSLLASWLSLLTISSGLLPGWRWDPRAPWASIMKIVRKIDWFTDSNPTGWIWPRKTKRNKRQVKPTLLRTALTPPCLR